MNILKKKKVLFFGFFLVVFSIIVFFNWDLQSQTASKEFYPDSDEISQVLNQLKYSYVDPERLEGYKIMRSVLERLASTIPPVVVHISKKENFKSALIQVEKTKKKFHFQGLKKCQLFKKLSFLLKELKTTKKKPKKRTFFFFNIFIVLNNFIMLS